MNQNINMLCQQLEVSKPKQQELDEFYILKNTTLDMHSATYLKTLIYKGLTTWKSEDAMNAAIESGKVAPNIVEGMRKMQLLQAKFPDLGPGELAEKFKQMGSASLDPDDHAIDPPTADDPSLINPPADKSASVRKK